MDYFDSLNTFRTYAGCYEGRPSSDNMLESIKRQAVKRWGERPTYVVETKIDPVGDRLPPWCHMCMFNSHTPVKDPTEHGSQLLVIWFSEDWSCDPNEVVAQIDWNKHAGDFSF